MQSPLMHSSSSPILLDCTLRDGGYYNLWDFPRPLIEAYLQAMRSAHIDYVEIGYRLFSNTGYKGPCAYATDTFLNSLDIPSGLSIGVMINGSDLCTDIGFEAVLERLFPSAAHDSPVELVRVACHFHELPIALPAAGWLSRIGYRVGFNLMQIADCSHSQLVDITAMANDWPIDVLYFADSMGSMTPDDTARIVFRLREGWEGELGIHTHDNMGLALANTLRAHTEGVKWLDSTVTGMGRGPGNARTEELAIEAEDIRKSRANLVPLMDIIRESFAPMRAQYRWGTNPFYYLAGKYSIHPSYIQEMLVDSCYSDEDILAVIDYLRDEGGKSFSSNSLAVARQFYRGTARGTWNPASIMRGREILILGSGPSAENHRSNLETYARIVKPLVLALNTQSPIDPSLIDLRIACHPVRLLADAETYSHLPQPLITPASMLPDHLYSELKNSVLLDFGLGVESNRFEFHDTYCISPNSLVLAYALAVCTSGKVARITMAGFDGYQSGDRRNEEIELLLANFIANNNSPPIESITRTRFKIPTKSLYAI